RILGELLRGGFIDSSVSRVDDRTLAETIIKNDIMSRECSGVAVKTFLSAPGQKPNFVLGSQNNYYRELDKDSVNGCIRSVDNAYHKDGGIAVLFGNIAVRGSIVKTAGVDESLLKFRGKALVYESQDDASAGIVNGEVKPGDVVVIRYEGPKGGPGMQEMLYPTSYLKSVKLDKSCALITDGRFSGGSSGLSVGHISPEAASGGEIALIRNGDYIVIDIPERTINLELTDREINERRQRLESGKENPYKPKNRIREISRSLKIYAQNVSSADTGAVRLID
ncbi:MAG: dihydroxy-acid dehydratase, partial [Bacteroidales bacterium]|nr:dihydroxy-acid dehydratase [Bacteroidales bacterium]